MGSSFQPSFARPVLTVARASVRRWKRGEGGNTRHILGLYNRYRTEKLLTRLHSYSGFFFATLLEEGSVIGVNPLLLHVTFVPPIIILGRDIS